MHSHALLVVACGVVVFASAFGSAGAQSPAPSPAPSVAGPIAATTPLASPAHGYPFSATPMPLARLGYVEEEFFIEGTANRYTTPPMATGAVTDGQHHYKTRVLVRRPAAAARFNGTAIVEWTNVSQGHDNEVDWFQSGAHFVRAGYAWIGVSAQRVGVDALKQWSPARYGSLDVSEGGAITNDALSYDIFAAAARAARASAGPAPARSSPSAQGPAMMGGLKVERLIATGHSQSAGRLYTYFTSIHPLAPIFDGVVLHGGGGQIRLDIGVKVWKFLSETDVPGQSRQADSATLRTWEVAGTSHLDAQLSRGLGSVGLRAAGGAPVEPFPAGATISGGGAGIGDFQQPSNLPNDGCAKPIFSRVPSHYVQNALYDHFARWIKDGTLPPKAPPIQLKDAPPPAPGADAGERGGGRGGPPPPRYLVVRDGAGHAVGGIRLAELDVPTAINTGQNSGSVFCGLLGSHEAFDAAKLASLYPTRDAYVARVKAVTDDNLKAGFILKADAEATIEDARRANIGKR